MKRLNKLQLLVILVYIVACIVLYFSTQAYIKSKDSRLEIEAKEQFQEFFSEQKTFVATEYSEGKVTYSSTPISEYYKLASKGTGFSKWIDLYELYELEPNQGEYGWALSVIEASETEEGAFLLSEIRPQLVGFKRDDYSRIRPHSVQGAIDRFFNTYISNYQKYIKEDLSADDIIESISNKYYRYFKSDKPIGEEKYYFAQDRDYVVTTLVSPLAYYQLKYNEAENPKAKDKKNTLIWGYIILTLCLGLGIWGVKFIEQRQVIQENETFKDKLLRRCNPTQFMKPYDEKKVSLANDLYEKILKTDEEDIEGLKLLRKDAEKLLGIDFYDKKLLSNLLSITNPKRYMKPYDAEKVRLANQLHTKLRTQRMGIEELEAIEQEIYDKLI